MLHSAKGREIIALCKQLNPQLFEDIVQHEALMSLNKEEISKRYNGVSRLNQECLENFPNLIAVLNHRKELLPELTIDDFFDESIVVDATKDVKQQRKEHIISLLGQNKTHYSFFLNLLKSHNKALFHEFSFEPQPMSLNLNFFSSTNKPKEPEPASKLNNQLI